MEERTTQAYQDMWNFVRECYFEEYPEEPELTPKRIVCDFEQANILAIRMVFPNIEISNCSFHMINNLNKKFLKFYNVKRETNKTAEEIWNFLSGIPYVRWTPDLVDELERILMKVAKLNLNKQKRLYRQTSEQGARKKKLRSQVREAEGIYESTERMVQYLRRTYLSPTHEVYSYTNWANFNDITDKTNNVSESCNKQFNRYVLNDNRGFLSFKRFVFMTTKFIFGKLGDDLVSSILDEFIQQCNF